jgi:proline dehydrogenase
VNGYLRKTLQTYTLPIAKWASRAYVAGPALSDAIEACHKFSRQGILGTVGYWNGDEDTPELVAEAYLAAIESAAREVLDCYLSIKAPALGFDRNLTAKITGKGKEVGVGVHFDSLAPEIADRTFELVAESVRLFPQIGCTLPGRWRRSLQDANLVAELGVNVRVVKGQWVDPDHPEIDLREGYLAVIDRLAGRARRVAVATHDPLLARESLRRLLEAGTPCDLELLFGLPMKAAMHVARDLGVRIRVYIPYGESWLPYAFSQVQKNPRILWWVIRDSVFGNSLG